MPIAFPAPLQDRSAIWAKNVIQSTFDGIPAPNMGNPNYRFSLSTLDGGMGKLIAHADANMQNPGGSYAASYTPYILPLAPTLDTVVPASRTTLLSSFSSDPPVPAAAAPLPIPGIAFPSIPQDWPVIWAKNLIVKPFNFIPAPNMGNPGYVFNSSTLNGGRGKLLTFNANTANPGVNSAIPAMSPFGVVSAVPTSNSVVIAVSNDQTRGFKPFIVDNTGFYGPIVPTGNNDVFLRSVVNGDAINDVRLRTQNPGQVLIVGVEATTAVGDTNETGLGFVSVTGVEATGAIGDEIVVANDVIILIHNGLQATGAIGNVIAEGNAVILYPSGLQATGSIGNVYVKLSAYAFPTGVQGTFFTIGRETVWTSLNVNQSNVWSRIAA
jgi:hypothetical protein